MARLRASNRFWAVLPVVVLFLALAGSAAEESSVVDLLLDLSGSGAGRSSVVDLLLDLPGSVAAQSDYVNPHNSARKSVGANIPNLSWDNKLADYATRWAQGQASQDACRLKHSGGPYGENIYWSSGSSTPGDAVTAWVNEKAYYNYSSNSCKSGQQCGHYTQVVWKNTQRVGCGSARCSGGGTFVVCSYDPPGNIIGQRPY